MYMHSDLCIHNVLYLLDVTTNIRVYTLVHMIVGLYEHSSICTGTYVHLIIILCVLHMFLCMYYRSGHSKGIAAIKYFPRSAHLLLSGGMDSKVKVRLLLSKEFNHRHHHCPPSACTYVHTYVVICTYIRIYTYL